MDPISLKETYIWRHIIKIYLKWWKLSNVYQNITCGIKTVPHAFQEKKSHSLTTVKFERLVYRKLFHEIKTKLVCFIPVFLVMIAFLHSNAWNNVLDVFKQNDWLKQKHFLFKKCFYLLNMLIYFISQI